MKAIQLLTGPNRVFRAQHLEKLLKKNDSQDISTYYPGETDASVIFDQCYQDSLFGTENIVVVKDIADVKDKSRKDAFISHLENYAKQFNPSTRLIIEWEKLPARISKTLKDVPEVEVKEFKKVYKTQEMARYIQDSLKDQGLNIEKPAVDLVLQLANNDLDQIAAFTQLLGEAVPPGSTLQYQTARETLSRAHNLSVFDLIDALFKQDQIAALQALNDLRLEGQSVIAVSNMIMRSTRLLWAIVSQPGADKLYTELSISPYEFKKLKSLSSMVHLKHLSKMLSLLSTIEIRSKTGPEEFAWLELESYILSWKGMV